MLPVAAIVAMLINALGWSIKPIIEKTYILKSNFVYFTFIRYIVAGCMVIVPMILYYALRYAPKSYTSPKFVKSQVCGAALAAVAGIIAALSNYYLLSKFKVSYVIPALEGLVILITVGLSRFILGESVSLTGYVGMAAIIAGILMLGHESLTGTVET